MQRTKIATRLLASYLAILLMMLLLAAFSIMRVGAISSALSNSKP